MNRFNLPNKNLCPISQVSLLTIGVLPCISMADNQIQSVTSHQTSFYQSTGLSQALSLAKQKNLATSTAWRRFLYFDDLPNPKDDKSRVINRFNPLENQRKFFVSQNGGHDPQAELQATITALFDPTLANDNAVVCRFPARVNWLKQQLNLDNTDLPAVNCPSYHAWQAKIQPQTAEIVFATEYLDSLPSAFAHSFLLFNNDKDPYYLNYTPKSTEGESQVTFAYKSAIAGNAGEFTINNYAEGIQNYKVNQGRDVWRYRLKLTDSQVEQLANQVFEIKDQILPYYLLDENCASEILVLLNTLLPQKNYLAGMHATIAPAQIVRRLQAAGMIESGNFEPSVATQHQANLNAKKTPLTDNAPLVASRNNPEFANPLRQWSVGYVAQNSPNSDNINALKLGYRLVYHDPLDRLTGYPIGSQLTGLSADVLLNPDAKHRQNKVQLEQATLIKIRSLNPINTAKNKASWGIDVSLQQAFDKARYQQQSDDDSHLVGNINLEYGKSFAYGSPLAGSGELPPNICYGLGNVASQFGKGLDNGFRVGLGANLGCIQQFGQNFRGLAEISLPYWLSGDRSNERYWQPKLSIGAQYDINQFNAIRLLASRDFLGSHSADKADKVSVSYVTYFE